MSDQLITASLVGIVSASEQARLDACSVEPIHVPGAIQPHGALLAVDATTFTIRQVSANTGEILGVDPTELLGRSVEGTFGEAWLRDALRSDEDRLENPFRADVRGRSFDVIVHRSGSMLIMEFEIAVETDPRLLPRLNAAIRRISSAETVEALRSRATQELRDLLSFDRVVVYHFYADGHGEVVAEDRLPELEPYLHQHFPASDIPVQARALYVKKASQQIASSTYTPVPILSASDAVPAGPLDLTRAELRSVSPHHLQYIQNMGTAATISLSLVDNGRLIGMITCSAVTPRMVSYSVRRACEVIAQQLTLQLGMMAQRRKLERQLEYRRVRSAIIGQIEATTEISSGLCGGAVTLLDLISADGAIARIDGNVTFAGEAPPPQTVLDLARWVSQATEPVRIATHAVSEERAEIAAIVGDFAGVVIWQCGGAGDFLAWFRKEVSETVTWLGDQSDENRNSALSPRNSFSLWRQSVEGRSQPWMQDDLEQIDELIRDLDGIRAERAVTSDMNRAADVQRALQPRDLTPAAGYEVAGICMPTGTVGGDFYDWYSVDGGLAVTLGDVMGKGVGAGMIAAAVRTALRFDRSSADSSVPMSRASAMVGSDLAETSSFVTLFHARIESATGMISYSDAGHGLSIIVRDDGSFVRLEGSGYPLGLSIGNDITPRSEQLDPGDMLISFSDGVLDMIDGSLDAVNVVVELARSTRSPQSLVDGVASLARGVTTPDDVTVVVVRREVRDDASD